jgi:hypothetical protein
MMDHAPLTETQRALMPDLGDDACGFWDLVWLRTGEQRAQESSDAPVPDRPDRSRVEVASGAGLCPAGALDGVRARVA